MQNLTEVVGQFLLLEGQVGQKSKKYTKCVHLGSKAFQISHFPLPYLPYRASSSVAYHLYYMISLHVEICHFDQFNN